MWSIVVMGLLSLWWDKCLSLRGGYVGLDLFIWLEVLQWEFHNLLLEHLLTIIRLLQVLEGALHVHLMLHLFESAGLTRMRIIVMCADHNDLWFDFVFQWNTLYSDLWFFWFRCVWSKFWNLFWIRAYIGLISVSPLPLGHNLLVVCENFVFLSFLIMIPDGGWGGVGGGHYICFL